ncbi:MAG: tetratricopeptide repeat protein, partial [Thermoplasmatota archaeon]
IILQLGDKENLDTSREGITLKEYIVKCIDVDEGFLDEIFEKLLGKEMIENDEKNSFVLTEKGKNERENIWDDIKDEEVVLIDNDDSIKLRLEDLIDILDNKSLIEIFDAIEKNVLDLSNISFQLDKLIDREQELDKLKKDLERTIDGEGNTIFIEGEKGIGKTRLVYEIKKMALEEGFDFIKGGSIVGDYNPYRPFKDALSKFSKIQNDKKAFSSLVSDFNLTTSDRNDKEMFDAQRKSIFYDTKKYVEKLSDFRPIVIFLDDLQWADKGTLNLLDYMADKLQDKPVLFIGAYRPGDVTGEHALNETMNRMSRKKLYDKIVLDQLNDKAIEELIKNLTDSDDVPEEFVKNMKDKTNGNPLFIEESIKQMIDDGLISQEDPSFPDEKEIVLTSDMVEEVIGRRITNFDYQTRRVLQMGSVIGKKVPFDLLVDACDIDELELLDIIDSIMESKLWIEHTDEESFVFYHDLFVETIYNGLGRWLERKNYHMNVAKAIENVYDDLSDRYSKVAYHYKNAEEYKKASSFYHKAGCRAEEVYAHEDAIERYKEALKMANRSDDIEKKKMFEILEDLSDALSIKGEYKEERMYLKQAMTHTEDLENKRRIYRKISKSFMNQSKYNESLEIIEEGLDLTEDDIERSDIDIKVFEDGENYVKSPETCRLLSEKGWIMIRVGKYDEAKKIFKKELQLAEEVNHKPTLSQAYHDLGTPRRSNIDSEKSIEYLNKSLEIRNELLENRDNIEDKLGKSKTLNNIGAIYSREGKLDKALDYFKRSVEIDEEMNINLEKGRTLNNISYILIMKGKLDEVSEYLERGEKISKKIGDKQGLSRLATTKFALCKERGEFDKALDHIKRSQELAEEIDDIFGMFVCFKEMTDLYILMNNLDKAKENLKKAEGIASKVDNSKFNSIVLTARGWINRVEGNYEKAVDNHCEGISLSEKVDESSDVFDNRYHLIRDYIAQGEIDKANEQFKVAKEQDIELPDVELRLKLLEGILKRKERDFEESKEILEDCLEITKELSKEYRIAEVLYELGKVNRELGEKEEAERLLNDAKKRFKDMNMERYLVKCNKELNEL